MSNCKLIDKNFFAVIASFKNYGDLVTYQIDFYRFIYLRSFNLSSLYYLTNNNNKTPLKSLKYCSKQAVSLLGFSGG